MPVITVQLRSGRTEQQKRELVDRLTTAFVETCGGEREGVWVALQEIPAEHWGIGGKLQSDLMGITTPPAEG
ncbi:2-hydroxymuconate tautomerase [Actinokineospora inagensis]|uniref:2-hydroxymuconate tautomerase n=1 Tax=Actinokineospora inagensis TaxID=103730 RepID=UPI000422F3FC|nr:2-hydroxymuconate tautomerase [Actinokineospora inagensis]